MSLVFLGLALLEDDGLFCAFGLTGTLINLAYHAAFARMVWNFLRHSAMRLW